MVNDSDQTLPIDPDLTQSLDNKSVSGPRGPLPETIGHYKPLRIIGQGGMGVVYEAEQEEPRRRVALKVIRPDISSEELRRRFAHESLFLGRLQHPGIAQVYEAGTAQTEAGEVPFIAMELVDGVPLSAWVQKHEPDRRTRIKLMIQICDAVHHAHQRGLIHRDLKPANILMDDHGRPRVLDFGVARPTGSDLEASLMTTHGELVGTVSHMSPEQLDGDPNDLDTRSDIYALGVILYQLLADKPPLELHNRPLADALMAIREEDPPALSTVDPKLSGDLSIITAMAMEKDREQRYASANGLGLDLQRHLDDQPIAARPPGTMYLMRKFARRNRPLVIGAAGVAVALVLGFVGSTWQAVRATRAEVLAEARLDQAESVTGFLQDMLAAIQPQEAKGKEVTVHEVLDRAAIDLDEGSLTDQPQVEAALRHTLGNTYRSLGEMDSSQRHLQKGLVLVDSLLEDNDTERLKMVLDLSTTIYLRGDIGQAEKGATEIIDLAHSRSELTVEALHLLGQVRYAEGHWETADSLQQLAQQIAQESAETEAGMDSSFLANVILTRAFLAQQRNDLALADSLTNMASAIYEQSGKAKHSDLIKIRLKKGDIANSRGLFQESRKYYEEALALVKSIYSPDHPMQADVLWRLGDVCRAAGDFDAADAAFSSSLKIRQQALGPNHRDIALVLTSLGNLAAQRGQFDVAESRHRESLAMREAVFGPIHPSVVASVHDLGRVARKQQKPAVAESLYVHARTILDQLPESTGRLASLNAYNTAMSLQDQSLHAEAEVFFRKALEIERQLNDPPHLHQAQAISNVGTSLFRQGRKSEAADLFVEALQMHREMGIEGDGLLTALGNTAYLLDDAQRYEDADPLHQEFISLAGQLYDVKSPAQSDGRGRYFENLMKRKMWAEAENQARIILAWREEYLPEDDTKRATGTIFLVEALLGMNRATEAEQAMAKLDDDLKRYPNVSEGSLARIERARSELEELLAAQ
jgi:eukaryotic-like serine/threonine-protein kinase